MGGQNPAPAYPGPITTAAVNAQRRRLSLTTIGLSASPNQTSPFQGARPRTESLSSANSGSVDESPFEEDATSSASGNPASPFARRLSFGARALRDVRQGNGSLGNSNGRPPTSRKPPSPPTARGRGLSSSSAFLPRPTASPSDLFSHQSSPSHSSVLPQLAVHYKPHSEHAYGEHELTSMLSSTGERYNFAENLRTRAERGSISGTHPMQGPQGHTHQRAKSVAIMEPPAREMPKQPKVPDAMQERILKGDFYMD
jgi:hypothetical protein